MTNWIDLSALWRIVVVGLICGAGLPALFAVGLKALAMAEGDTTTTGGTTSGGTTSGGSATAARGNPALLGAAGLCFAVVLAAIGWGIYLIVSAT